ncbi:MAG: hypothetical protein EOP42_04245 [Sphingobacteriaceae bacterium]|nr:MAG: hypothetical protein EOP42_04245 [Sphingobacteriaceae bacterium]
MSVQQTPGKIYLADNRGMVENKIHQCFSTFNFAGYQQLHKQPFGKLHTFNDEVLPAGGSLGQAATIDGFMLLIPITGAIKYCCQKHSFNAEAGQVVLIPIHAGMDFEITNPYTSDWVNFLHLEIKAEALPEAETQILAFDIEQDSNMLIPVMAEKNLPFALHIGRFSGRTEVTHEVKTGNVIFVFVIGGAFELQNRLLHSRDGLALWDIKEVEAEALSNDAVLLLLELENVL